MKDFTARDRVFWCTFQILFYIKKMKKGWSSVVFILGFGILFGCGKKGDPQPVSITGALCSARDDAVSAHQCPKGAIPAHQYPKK